MNGKLFLKCTRQNVNYCGELKISTVERDFMVCFFREDGFHNLKILQRIKIWGILLHLEIYKKKNLSRVYKNHRIICNFYGLITSKDFQRSSF